MTIDKSTAEQIKNKFYVDDGALSANSREELEAMRGSRNLDGQYSGKISEVLGTVGMAPKFIAIPGSASEEEIELLGGKFLGIGYNINEDKIAFSLDTLVKVDHGYI